MFRSALPAPAGDRTLAYHFEYTTRGGPGVGILSVDNVEVARMDYPATLRGRVSFVGMDVGCDRLVPVGSYPGPFPFTGTLDRVVIELAPEADVDAQAREAAELAGQ